MNKLINHLTVALTVALLSTSPVVYSDMSSHNAIVDAFDATYDHSGQGMMAVTDENGVTTLLLLGINDNHAQLCDTFGGMASHLVVIDANLDEKRIDCSM